MSNRQSGEELSNWLKENEKSVFVGIYLTLFSVVGGVVLGLIAQSQSEHLPTFVPVDAMSVESAATITMAVATLLVLATILTGYVLNVLYFYWSVSPLDVMLSLLLGISLCFAAAHTDTPATWMLWIGLTGIFGGLSYVRTRYQLSREEIPSVKTLRKRTGSSDEFGTWLANEKEYLATSAIVSILLGLLFIGGVTFSELRLFATKPWPTMGIAAIVIAATTGITFGLYPKRFEKRREIFKD